MNLVWIKVILLTLLCFSPIAFGEESTTSNSEKLNSKDETAEEDRTPVLEYPVVPFVVHNPDSLFAKRFHLQLGPSSLSGDPFLSTTGVGVQATYFISEEIGVHGGLFIFQSQPSSNVAELQAKNRIPVAHNPSQIGSLGVLYSPWYGKFTLGSRIQRFKWFLTAGGHAANEKTVDKVQSQIQRSERKLGGNLGTGFLFPLTQKLTLSLQMQSLFHGSLLETENSGRRNFLYGIQLGYIL